MAVRGLQDVSASYRFIERVFSVLQIETARQGSDNLWLPLFSCSALLCCWLLEKSQVSSLSCRISSLTGTSEYVFRLRRRACVGQRGLLIEIYFVCSSNFSSFQRKVFRLLQRDLSDFANLFAPLLSVSPLGMVRCIIFLPRQ